MTKALARNSADPTLPRLLRRFEHLLRFCLVLLMVPLVLAGCVIETGSSSLGNKADPEKALTASIQAGVEYLKIGDIDGALRHFNRAIKIDKRSPEAHNSLALLYRVTGDVALEEKHFKKAIQYNDKFATARNNYGAFLFRQGRYKEALKQLQKAAVDPTYEKRDSAYENIGVCALKLNKVDLAQAAFVKALRLNPMMSRPYIELAAIAFERNQIDQAAIHLKKFNSVSRSSPRSLLLSLKIARQRDDRDAIASHELALKNLFPESDEYRLYKESMAE